MNTPRLFACLTPLAALLLFAQQQAPSAKIPLQGGSAPAAATVDAAPPAAATLPAISTSTQWDAQFLAVPDPNLARQHLQALTSAPHWASSPEDYATAKYVAERFKEAGLQTRIVPYRVLLDKPVSVQIEAFDADGKRILNGPTPEHADLPPGSLGDRLQSDPRVLPPFNSSSASADVTAEVVYANYGRLADFKRLADLGISVKGKIALVRYGRAYRGVKVYTAQQFGAKGVLIYSDPADAGVKSPKPYPTGPDRPDFAVQRGSVQFMPIYPGDPTTPGIASVPDLPASKRIPTDKLQYNLPSIPANPLSSADAAPILRGLTGPEAPRDWQGGLGFPYRLGAGPVTVRMRIVNDRRLRTIWDVIGTIPGASDPKHLVIAGNHRDAWVYGAADPNSGTAAMLEAVHGLGVLLQHHWRPRRTIVIASWDAEEEGMVGSTEWVEQHSAELADAVAYFNVDVAVSGPNFHSEAVPSLRPFLEQIASEVPSPAGGTVLQQGAPGRHRVAQQAPAEPFHIGELGSGSDYTPFLQHAGVPSTDIGSDGPYSVYHSVFDNFDWFTRFVDPNFAYTQQQARVLGLEVLHMADASVLPFDYRLYARSIRGYLDQASSRAAHQGLNLDFSAADSASDKFAAAAQAVYQRQLAPPADPTALNDALDSAEHALLLPQGLPARPWYRHSIYAPGIYTGYEAVVIPGVNEAIDSANASVAQSQLDALAQALTRAAASLWAGAN